MREVPAADCPSNYRRMESAGNRAERRGEGVDMASGHFDDKVCVITGAVSGIGSAVSEAAAGGIIAFPDTPKQLWRQ